MLINQIFLIVHRDCSTYLYNNKLSIFKKEMSFGSKIRSLDVFKKVPKDFSQATTLGGIISIITSALIIFFVYAELERYLHPPYTAEIIEDKLVTR